MRNTLVRGFATALLVLASVQPAMAANDVMTPIAAPAQPSAIPLGTGALPGATVKESWHEQYGSSFARNVTEATLTPFLPDPAKTTGVAVIVAPGGGFRTLSMQNEGWDVAKALAARGIAALAERYDVDVLCVGTRGRTGVAKAVLGSVAMDVIATTRKPVLLVRDEN